MTNAVLWEMAARLQEVSDTYAARKNVRRDPDWYLLKLQEELGELVAEYLRLQGGKSMKASEDATREALADETADLLAHVLLFVHQNGVDIDSALQRKWFKHMGSKP